HQGGDLAFLNAVAKVLLQRNAIDDGFVRDHTRDFDAWKASLDAQRLEDLIRLSGSTPEQVSQLADELARARNGILIWSMGITQPAHGSETVKAIANLALMRGWVGHAHAGLVPIRGHSGVQGGAEMGAYATALPGGLAVNEANARRFSELYGFPVPARPGRATTEMIAACDRGEVSVLYSVGGNFLDTLPKPKIVARALEK